MNRICTIALIFLGATLGGPVVQAGDDDPRSTLVEVYKTPTCGCCVKWIAHLEAAGFRVKATDLRDLRGIKARLGVPQRLGSCHTARVGNYVVEGHVPTDVILRLLAEKPAVAGLTVPGMPLGSPGMEAPNAPPYSVYAFTEDGKVYRYSLEQQP